MRCLFLVIVMFSPFLGQAALSSTVLDLSISVSFVASKTEHECINATGGPEVLGNGECGQFQRYEFAREYAGEFFYSGEFQFDGSSRFEDVWSGSSVQSCTLGNTTCLEFGESNALINLANDLVVFTPLNANVFTEYVFRPDAGTGMILWEDDDTPFFSVGRFQLRNVVVTGLPQIPLPASIMLIVFGSLNFLALRTKKAR